MRLQLQSWRSQRQCKHSDLESLVDQLQRASTSPVHNASTSFKFAFGHTLEPNATETVLNTVFVLAGYLQVLAAASEGVHAYSYQQCILSQN